MKNFWTKSLLILFAIFIFQLIEIYKFSKITYTSKADAALVLGAAVWHNKPSPVFAERINHAINLYKTGVVKKLIFTGGHFNPASHSEAHIAKIYALQKGVKEIDIFLEEESKNTKDNLLFSKLILEKERLNKVILVSDPIHMRRAVLISQKLGIETHSSPTPTSRFKSKKVKLEFLLKETLLTLHFRISNLLTFYLN